MFPHVEKGQQYALDVVEGRVPACKWVILACQRHLSDLARDDWDFYFDAKTAERWCKFISLLPHTKGKWAAQRQNIKLESWQCFKTIAIFGWLRKKDNTRRFRRVLILEPRKNAKSTWAAGVGLGMLCIDNEFGAEIYSGATSEKQAWEVFRPAHQMVKRTKALQDHYGIVANASNLNRMRDGSRFEPLIGKPGDGASPSCAIVDEYHEHDSDAMVDTMLTGMGARDQPLLLVITTAGDNMAGPCYSMQKDLEKVLEGVLEDDELFGLVYTIDTTKHDVIVQSSQFFRRLDEACQKRNVQTIQIGELWQEVYATLVTQLGEEITHKENALTTRIGQFVAEICADRVTRNKNSTTILNIEKEETSIAIVGLQEIPKKEVKQQRNTGLVQLTESQLEKFVAFLTTEYRQKLMSLCDPSLKDDVKSAVSRSPYFALTIAMIQVALEDCFVSDAIVDSVCLVIAKRLYREHTNIFANVREIEGDTYCISFDADDWTSPDTLRKANPNMGVSVGEDYLLSQQKQAINNPRKAGVFKTKHLNVWVQAREAYFNVQRWLEAKVEIDIEDFRNQPVRIGLDLASKDDIAAMELLFRLDQCDCEAADRLRQEGFRYLRFGRYFLPSEKVREPGREYYAEWADAGYILETEGSAVDYGLIKDEVFWVRDNFQLEEVSFDPHQARQMVSDLMEEGIECVEVRPLVINFSEPMKEKNALILEHRIAHDGDPVYSWMLSNVVAKADMKDNVYPTKDKAQPQNKIDGPVANIMVLARWMLIEEKPDLNDFLRNPVMVA